MVLNDSTIYINGLRLRAFHGVMDQERRVGGYFIVDLRVHCSVERAMQTDDVADTISYADLCELVRREMAVPSSLLEHVAGRICRTIVQTYPAVSEVELSLTKENPPMGADCAGAGVSLHVYNKG